MTPTPHQFEILIAFLKYSRDTSRNTTTLLRAQLDDADFDTFQAERIRACCSKLDSLAETLDGAINALRTKPA